MRYVVTPEFNAKMAQVPSDQRHVISTIITFIQSAQKETIISGASEVEVRVLNDGFFVIKAKNYRVYASIGSDERGEYLLLLDISSEQPEIINPSMFIATKDPTRNHALDPRRNTMIDPRRNMMIDPRRNMMIDPRRNMMIDPRRNMMIDPRRNQFYGGPYIYNADMEKEGFVVRANDDVSLTFDLSGNYIGFIASAKNEKNENVFDTTGDWLEFLIRVDSDVRLRFDLDGDWIGVMV
jgi:hypothetical protein